MAHFKFHSYHVPSHASKIHQGQRLAGVNCSQPPSPLPTPKAREDHSETCRLWKPGGRRLRSLGSEVTVGKRKANFSL